MSHGNQYRSTQKTTIPSLFFVSDLSQRVRTKSILTQNYDHPSRPMTTSWEDNPPTVVSSYVHGIRINQSPFSQYHSTKEL
jgi:hypothetical protein